MPRGRKIGLALSRQWLEEYEGGTSLAQLAKTNRRTKQVIIDNIERARQHLRFEFVQRDQLRDAFQRHQQDLLRLLQQLEDVMRVPRLGHELGGHEFGLEEVIRDGEGRTNEVDLASSQVLDIILGGGRETGFSVHILTSDGLPTGVELSAPSTILWEALQQHLKRDPLWLALRAWKQLLLDELLARAHLNRDIASEAKEIFDAPVKVQADHRERVLTTALPPYVRELLVTKALGEDPGLEDLVQKDNELQDRRKNLTLGRNVGEDAREEFFRLLAAMKSVESVQKMVDTHRQLKDRTEKVRALLEEYLLLHYIRGRCNLCKTLGGR